MSESTQQGSSTPSASRRLYPPRAIEIADKITGTLKAGGTVYVEGDGAEYFADRLIVKCNYDRPPLENVIISDGGDALAVGTVSDGVNDKITISMEDSESIPAIVERSMFGKKAVFFDRDDTINDDVGHCRRPEDIKIFPFVGDALKKLNDADLMTIMITNQSVIGRGWLDEEGLSKIHEKVRKDVLPGRIDDIFFCPHLPDGGCDCRKPGIGMALQALEKYNIDTLNSYMIGDSDRDVEFGEAIGCKSYKVSDDYTFADAVDDILSGLQ